ncbi:MAG: DUF5704 domain-containing protein [Lachnospiraceae bacterium]|nr:DUF5704 domain-containing protein [Lachnospiraceae bacterium]
MLCISLMLIHTDARADNEADLIKGNLVFYTTDTIAKSSTRWTEVGFNIRLEKTKGNPIIGGKMATIMLKPKYRERKLNNNGTYTVRFSIPETVVNDALVAAGMHRIEDGEYIYLNGIFAVIRQGKQDSEYYRTLSGIKGAADWRNKNDFDELFDVELKYHSSENHPLSIEYRTTDNVVIAQSNIGKYKSGTEKKVTIATSKTYLGSEYKLYKSYLVDIKVPTKKRDIVSEKNEKGLASISKTAKVAVGGTKVVAVMKKGKTEKPKDEFHTEILQKKVSEIACKAVIKSEDRGDEEFDVEEGIPTGKELYVNGFAPKYLAAYRLEKSVVTRQYPITFQKKYVLTWTENGKSKSSSKTVTKTVNVKRTFTYWSIRHVDIKYLNRMVVKNAALQNGECTLTAKNVSTAFDVKIHSDVNHVLDPTYTQTVTLKDGKVVGKDKKPTVPNEDFSAEAEKRIGQPRVRNDCFKIDTTVIMDDNWQTQVTTAPKEDTLHLQMCEADCMYLRHQSIPDKLENGPKETLAKVEYKTLKYYGTGDAFENEYTVEDANDVLVHTPVVCVPAVVDQFRQSQVYEPEDTDCSFIIGRTFQVGINTDGLHKGIKGYGWENYRAYTAKKRVKFPFPVYEDNMIIEENKWIELNATKEFYLPNFVKEGVYEIVFQCIAKNAVTEEQQSSVQEYANYNYENYVAERNISVEVSGRIGGFKIYDYSDYPAWRNVFRKENSLAFKGEGFAANQLPLTGSALSDKKTGFGLKAGYAFRMSLDTVGNLNGDYDYIYIKPRFYWVSRDLTHREEVDVYYSETVRGNYCELVKIGDSFDERNKKELQLGSQYLGIPPDMMRFTEKQKHMYEGTLRDTRVQTFSYGKIILPSKMQMYVGDIYSQKWFFEYYLPAKFHVMRKGYDVRTMFGYNPVNYQEACWLKEGYLVLNFDIYTVMNGKIRLSYINRENEENGYLNRWHLESSMSPYRERHPIFDDGDIAVFSLEESVATDYQNLGLN